MDPSLTSSLSATYSRRAFIRMAAASSLTAALAACTPSTNPGLVMAGAVPTSRKETIVNDQMRELVRLATLAPSGHNTQPWKFSVTASTIRIFPDYGRQLPVVDPQHRELFISLGCTLENLVLAAGGAGFASDVTYFPPDEPECLRVNLVSGAGTAVPALRAAIPDRQCTRSVYDGQPVPAADRRQLEESASGVGIETRWFGNRAEFEPLIEYVIEGDRRQYTDGKFLRELEDWLRFNDAEAMKARDGLSNQCTGNPSVPRWLGTLFLQLSGPRAQVPTDERNLRSSSGMILLASAQDDKRSWVDAGRAVERFALTATSLGIKMAFMNQPPEVPDLRRQLQSYLGLGTAFPQLLVRFGYAKPMPRSLRRPLEEVLI